VIVGGGEEEDSSTQQSIGVNRLMLWWVEGGNKPVLVGSANWHDGCGCCVGGEWVG
jgi:hypothetical protein